MQKISEWIPIKQWIWRNMREIYKSFSFEGNQESHLTLGIPGPERERGRSKSSHDLRSPLNLLINGFLQNPSNVTANYRNHILWNPGMLSAGFSLLLRERCTPKIRHIGVGSSARLFLGNFFFLSLIFFVLSVFCFFSIYFFQSYLFHFRISLHILSVSLYFQFFFSSLTVFSFI